MKKVVGYCTPGKKTIPLQQPPEKNPADARKKGGITQPIGARRKWPQKKQICVEFAVASQEMYRDYFNNFLSITAFADYYGISDTLAKAVISVGREQHELSVGEKK